MLCRRGIIKDLDKILDYYEVSKEDRILLSDLNKERSKYPKDKTVMEGIVAKLIKSEIYPSDEDATIAMQKNHSSVMDMVESYGAYWVFWDFPIVCIYCRTDLRDIENGPPFKREIGIYDIDLDRTVKHICPECNKVIERRDFGVKERKINKWERT